MEIRPYSGEYAEAVADLFTVAVHAIELDFYDEKQNTVWAPTPPDYAHWAQRLERKQPWLAMVDGHLAGFIELDADGHIDCTYVHPKFQRRGVATALYRQLETEARSRRITRLYVEASLVAEPFFDRQGFTRVEKNSVKRNDIVLRNTTMEKHIGN